VDRTRLVAVTAQPDGSSASACLSIDGDDAANYVLASPTATTSTVRTANQIPRIVFQPAADTCRER